MRLPRAFLSNRKQSWNPQISLLPGVWPLPRPGSNPPGFKEWSFLLATHPEGWNLWTKELAAPCGKTKSKPSFALHPVGSKYCPRNYYGTTVWGLQDKGCAWLRWSQQNEFSRIGWGGAGARPTSLKTVRVYNLLALPAERPWKQWLISN